jgi:hypothetical protein
MITSPNMGLKIWNLQSDPYNSDQLAENFAKVDNHDHSNGRGLQINGSSGIVDGSITSAKLASGVQATPLDGSVTTAKIVNTAVTADKLADAARLGLTDSGSVRRGTTGLITASETITATSYSLAPTPDRVQSIVLPTDGFIAVMYQAAWQESVKNAARAALFLGANQVKAQSSFAGPSGQGPSVVEAAINSPTNLNIAVPLFSTQVGLMSMDASAGASISANVVTGQVIGGIAPDAAVTYSAGTSAVVSNGTAGGGPCYIFAAAGTYDISVQFKASSGNVTVNNRRLWVWTVGF